MIAILVGACIAGLIALVSTDKAARWMTARGLHQPINPNVPQHGHKQVPTMGGIGIMAGILAASAVVAVAADVGGLERALIVLLGTVGAGAVGLTDDLIKLNGRRRRMEEGARNVNQGLTSRQKMAGLLAIGVVLGLVTMWTGAAAPVQIPFTDPVALAPSLVVVVAVALVAATANAVNLTDGIDGLAGGAAAMTFASLGLTAFWMVRHGDDYVSTDLAAVAVVSGATAAACTGFLWWNCHPAQIFMGDAGALGLGGALAAVALVTGTEIYLLVFAGLFVLETLSVLVLVVAVRGFGKRPFRAPYHHELEERMPEPRAVVRLWLVQAGFQVLALSIFYAAWLDALP